MNPKLLLIKEQLEQLNTSITEYLESTNQEVIILKKEDFGKIKFLGTTKSGAQIFEFNNGVIFPLIPLLSNDNEHYTKLLSGELDRLILNKRETSVKWDNWIVNYKLESEVETKLRDLYKNRS